MRRLVLAALLAVAATPFSGATEALRAQRVSMLDGGAHGIAILYAGKTTVVGHYIAAMMRYRADQLEGSGPTPFSHRLMTTSWPDPGTAWTWAAADGSTVRRIDHGIFRLTYSERPGNLLVSIDCLDAGWPTFWCSDDRERQMSAPAPSTITFGGLEYRRVLPGLE